MKQLGAPATTRLELRAKVRFWRPPRFGGRRFSAEIDCRAPVAAVDRVAVVVDPRALRCSRSSFEIGIEGEERPVLAYARVVSGTDALYVEGTTQQTSWTADRLDALYRAAPLLVVLVTGSTAPSADGRFVLSNGRVTGLRFALPLPQKDPHAHARSPHATS